MTYHIEDWMSNHINLDGKTKFDSYEEARDEISRFADHIVDEAVRQGKYEADSQEAEDAHDGICEDLYAIEDTEEVE